MILPNKIISLEDSCLPKAAKLLGVLEDNDSVQTVYLNNKDIFLDISEFIDALDLLFILNKINVNLNSGVIQLA
jgi:hypothetical protein